MPDPLSWDLDGRNWPNRDASRFIQSAGINWHVQVLGSGPVVLLVHGTGAATHSWRALAPMLARHFTVIAPDLPGHGFTSTPAPERLSLPGMARALRDLLRALDMKPDLAVGHSAGAAILMRMSIDGDLPALGIVSVNGALLPFRGLASHIFSPLAKLMVLNPLVPRLFAWRAGDSASVERLIEGTGSKIDATGIAHYRQLVSNPSHVAAALRMMANWDLSPLLRDFPKLRANVVLVVGGKDLSVPPDNAFEVEKLLPVAVVKYLRGLGHLAHEERPEEIEKIAVGLARSIGVLPAAGS
jgi:magnesium chelatase accessory protein